jgi:transposase
VGPHLGGPAAAGGCRRPARLVRPLRGWHRDPGAPARGRSAPHKRGAAQQALGKSRGGFSIKLHLRVERGGKPVVLLLTAGERHEQTAFVPLLEQGAVKRPGGRGRPRRRPKRVVGDKGYSSGKVRRYLRQHGIGATILKQRDEQPQRVFDREWYRERNRVERCINRLKQYRRVATRYEKLAVNYLAMVTIAAILIWL